MSNLFAQSLLAHPVFKKLDTSANFFGLKSSQSTASGVGNLQSGPKLVNSNSIASRNGNELFIAYENTIRYTIMDNDNGIDTKPNKTYKLLNLPKIDFVISSLLINNSATFLAAIGENQVYIISLPRFSILSSFLNDDSKNLINVDYFSIANSIYYNTTNNNINLKILNVIWNPISLNDSNLIILSSDSIIRTFDLNLSNDYPFESYNLLNKIKNPISITFGSNFNSNDNPISNLSLYILNQDGKIYSLFPFYPRILSISKKFLLNLLNDLKFNSKKLNSNNNNNKNSNSLVTMINNQFIWLNHLINQINVPNPAFQYNHSNSLEKLYILYPLSNNLYKISNLNLIGPLKFNPLPESLNEVYSNNIISVNSGTINLLVISFNNSSILIVFPSNNNIMQWNLHNKNKNYKNYNYSYIDNNFNNGSHDIIKINNHAESIDQDIDNFSNEISIVEIKTDDNNRKNGFSFNFEYEIVDNIEDKSDDNTNNGQKLLGYNNNNNNDLNQSTLVYDFKGDGIVTTSNHDYNYDYNINNFEFSNLTVISCIKLPYGDEYNGNGELLLIEPNDNIPCLFFVIYNNGIIKFDFYKLGKILNDSIVDNNLEFLDKFLNSNSYHDYLTQNYIDLLLINEFDNSFGKRFKFDGINILNDNNGDNYVLSIINSKVDVFKIDDDENEIDEKYYQENYDFNDDDNLLNLEKMANELDEIDESEKIKDKVNEEHKKKGYETILVNRPNEELNLIQNLINRQKNIISELNNNANVQLNLNQRLNLKLNPKDIDNFEDENRNEQLLKIIGIISNEFYARILNFYKFEMNLRMNLELQKKEFENELVKLNEINYKVENLNRINNKYEDKENENDKRISSILERQERIDSRIEKIIKNTRNLKVNLPINKKEEQWFKELELFDSKISKSLEQRKKSLKKQFVFIRDELEYNKRINKPGNGNNVNLKELDLVNKYIENEDNLIKGASKDLSDSLFEIENQLRGINLED
ncbi:uncharacterized protein ASCRUDRAFT_74870 [Ascoidea rubescens DSM 1968]|uniref:Uncharacterized protein n=1 Tax=Ascoidea rubescens DSM 1968 TaxID=1344418 RepID=A0A1D2VLS2_9ASCO|nr:hypothetical protein ASCRUDRAFT_74870 [Ascoidea rubescens DSM 1968]ODV62507.1 hypothetical protein ASCRUDRAFT_74870 [Ascoidea rubescens DSM 1968]